MTHRVRVGLAEDGGADAVRDGLGGLTVLRIGHGDAGESDAL